MNTTDKDLKADRKATVRQCLVSRELLPKDALLRFVVGPNKQVVLDLAGKLPGKGLYVKAGRECLEKATAPNFFSKIAKDGGVRLGMSVDDIIARLHEHLLSMLAMSNKAGLAVTGVENVRELLAGKEPAAVIIAKGLSDNSRKKLHLEGVLVVELFDESELGSVFSRDSVSVIALKPGKISHAFADEALKLEKIVVKEEGK